MAIMPTQLYHSALYNNLASWGSDLGKGCFALPLRLFHFADSHVPLNLGLVDAVNAEPDKGPTND